MTPTKTCWLAHPEGSQHVEEYYWGGKYVCYINGKLSKHNYETTVKRIKASDRIKDILR